METILQVRHEHPLGFGNQIKKTIIGRHNHGFISGICASFRPPGSYVDQCLTSSLDIIAITNIYCQENQHQYLSFLTITYKNA
jgi:hypothetical protein